MVALADLEVAGPGVEVWVEAFVAAEQSLVGFHQSLNVDSHGSPP
jgi:hypothetical protein|tara:strand:- start:940 stop:1074 length:135 start_codon:yes stop_codon:yes gene_type:complete